MSRSFLKIVDQSTLFLALVFILVACSAENDNNKETEQAKSTTEKIFSLSPREQNEQPINIAEENAREEKNANALRAFSLPGSAEGESSVSEKAVSEKDVLQLTKKKQSAKTTSKSGETVSPKPRKTGNNLELTRSLFYKKKYARIIKKTFDKGELASLYYKARAYGELAKLEKARLGPSKRRKIEFVQYAKLLFKRIALHAKDEKLKGQAIVWLGILTWRYPTRKDTLKTRLYPFSYIRKNYPKSAFYNEAILYSGFLYEAAKMYSKAFRHYKKLSTLNSKDKLLDERSKRVLSEKRASIIYLKNLEQKRLSLLRKRGKLSSKTSASTFTKQAASKPKLPSEKEAIKQDSSPVKPLREVRQEDSSASSKDENAFIFD